MEEFLLLLFVNYFNILDNYELYLEEKSKHSMYKYKYGLSI